MKLSLRPTPQEFIDADDVEALVNVGALEVYGVLLVVDAAQGVQSAQRMLLLDSYYDEYRSVICHVAIIDGAVQ